MFILLINVIYNNYVTSLAIPILPNHFLAKQNFQLPPFNVESLQTG